MLNLAKTLIALGTTVIFGHTAPSTTGATYTRMTGAAADLQTALERHPWPEAVQEKRARIVFLMGFYESSWHASPLGDNDSGRACGVLQVHEPTLDLPEATCGAVRADRVLGWEVGIVRLQKLEEKCGNIRDALLAYATDGTCRPDKKSPMISWRCQKAGLNPETCE